ncbi:MAG: peptide chain release factor N(5)-glutamine methyltransferase [Alphaproteobacteria bacterium]|nr:peptide chain release factor N(5)-glutamine methyltransferase [Alphaproteobacteria bacterium]
MQVKKLLSELTERFERAGLDEARADARVLVAFGINKTPVFLRINPDFEVEADDLAKIQSFADRRLKHEPVSKITQTRGFWRLDFKVTPDVLDPRPDSETLIEEALKIFRDKSASLKILDLGTGSGCLAQALLCEYFKATAVGLDSSGKALAVAAENAAANGLKDRFSTVLADWNDDGWENGLGKFDLIVANPPYIAEKERETLAPEVVDYDPAQALFAGEDGLDAYRKIAPALPRLLKKDGVFITEFGKGQEEDVRRIVCSAGLRFGTFGVDLGKITRCLSAFYAEI